MRSATRTNSSSDSSNAAFLTSAGNKFKSADIRVPSLKKVNHSSERINEVIALLKSCQGKSGNEKKISLTRIREILSALPDDVSLIAVSPHEWTIVDTVDLRVLSAIRFYYMNPYVKTKSCQYIYRILTDCPDGMESDHINGDKMDNRRCNLRWATHSQNMANNIREKSPTSGFRGVSYNRGGYQARYSKKKLGTFDTPVTAARARDDYVRLTIGDNGVYNFPRLGERSALTGQIIPLEDAHCANE